MIREAIPEDYFNLLDVQIACVRSLVGTYTVDETESWVRYIENDGPDRYGNYTNHVSVGDDGRINGFVSETHTSDQLSAAIECLYVLPSDRGRRIGYLLLEEAEAHIPEGSMVRIRSTLNAVPFYESHGYRRVGNALSRAGLSIGLLEKRLH